MIRKVVIGALCALAVTFSTTAFTQGTSTEAKAMLEKAVAPCESRQSQSAGHDQQGRRWASGSRPLRILLQYQRRQGRCYWQQTAKKVIGQDVRTLKDATGKVLTSVI